MTTNMCKNMILLICAVLLPQVLCRQEFCEKDDNTGLCKVGDTSDEEEDGPCWIEEEAPKKNVEQKLVRLDGVKVRYFTSLSYYDNGCGISLCG